MKHTKKGFVLQLIAALVLLGGHLPLSAQTLVPYTVDQSATAYKLKKAFGLPGGKSAVITMTGGSQYICTIVNNSGTAVSSFDFTDKIAFPNSVAYTEVNAIGTSTGNIFVIYTSATTTGMSNNTARFIILSQTGTLVNSGVVNATNPGASLNRFFDLAVLSNGNIAMIWLQSDNLSGAVRIFTSDGTPVTGDIVFAGPGSSLFNSSHLSSGNKIAANPNGGFLVSFYYNSGDFRAMRFDNAGNLQTTGGASAFVIDPTPYTGNYSNYAAMGLSNGNYMLNWRVGSTSYYKTISAAGSDVKAKTTLHPDLVFAASWNGWIGCVPANPTATPGYSMATFVWQDFDDLSNPYGKVVLYNYDLSGNFLNTSDLTSNFIADFNPVPSLYAGIPAGIGMAYNVYKTYTPGGGSYTLPADTDVKGVLMGVPSGTLPVSLVSFTAVASPQASVQLRWQTAAEDYNSHYTVQKSADGVTFTPLGQVKAKGSSGSPYFFTDENPFQGINYYRLLQTDADGKTREMGVRMVKLSKGASVVSIYPNPVTQGKLTVTLSQPAASPLSYQLVDAGGSLLQSGVIGSQQQSIDISRLPAGLYLLKLSNGQSQMIEKK